MGSRKIMMLVGSILLGALAGFALLSYVSGVEQEVEQRAERVPVFVVNADIEAGTSANDVRATARIEERQIETQFRPSNAINSLDQIEGRVAVSNLAANQIIVAGMFDEPEAIETTFADLIQPSQIAFSFTIDRERAVAGMVEPGDFVDIIVREPYIPPADGADAFAVAAAEVNTPFDQPARFLYRGVRVLGVDDDIVGVNPTVDPETGEEAAAPATGDGPLQITIAIPADAAQRLLSVNEENLILALLPDQWEPSAVLNEIPDLIEDDVDLPGEDPSQITPYGENGFDFDTLIVGDDEEDEDADTDGEADADVDAETDEDTAVDAGQDETEEG